ncbi:MAG: WecB/TagA/CpsF family glycosyltransferase [Desulfotomaculaceae bacterium]|nr:WecB/TagA/CpsF family glycosyltransferase [Desulfotomaculaceae bacterium]
MEPEVYSFLGINIHALTMDDLFYLIEEAITRNEQYIIAHHNLHSLYIFHHNAEMREFYARAKFIYIDGMPIVFLGRLWGHPLERRNRFTSVDWVRPLMQQAARQGWRVFFLGSEPGVAARGAEILKNEIQGLQLETQHGYFDASPENEENHQVLQRIESYQPRILMVGMGMPRQECWILNNLPELHANVVIAVGATMDYMSGAAPTPPRWMGQLGLEWLYRLVSEPRRLWRRYLVEPFFVLNLLARSKINK